MGLVFVGVEQCGIDRFIACSMSRAPFVIREPKVPSGLKRCQRSSRPYMTAAMSHNTAMMRNIAPIGSTSNIMGGHCFDATRRDGKQ